MTYDELRQHAESLLRIAIDELRETGNPTNCFHLIGPDTTDVIVVAGDSMNNPRFKDSLALDLRQRITTMKATAYFMVTDMFLSRFRSDDKQAAMKERIRRALGLTIEQAAQAGLCEAQEAIGIVGETREGRSIQVMQEYLRNPTDSKQISIQGEPSIQEMAGGYGRFFKMFEPVKPGSLHDPSAVQ